MARGKPRKIKSPAMMERLWEEYKDYCDNQLLVPVTEFNQRSGEFVSDKIHKRITYTIEGFCVFIGMLRQVFYATYARDERYCDIVSRIREECEFDARSKFESGTIPHQLAALWMSKYGYSAKTETTTEKPNELLQSLLDLERGAVK